MHPLHLDSLWVEHYYRANFDCYFLLSFSLFVRILNLQIPIVFYGSNSCFLVMVSSVEIRSLIFFYHCYVFPLFWVEFCELFSSSWEETEFEGEWRTGNHLAHMVHATLLECCIWESSVTWKMIAYVDCISPQPAGKCWNRTYYEEDEDELLPLHIHKPYSFQSKNGGSLRRKLLTSRFHQQQDRLWHSKHCDRPPALTSTQPFQKHHSSTFKPMQEDFTGSCTWSAFTATSFIHVLANPQFWFKVLK